MAESQIFTIGHSTRTRDEFIALLDEFHVDLVADVRSIPRSRTNPQFNGDALAETLPESGIAYRHVKALGGRRGRTKEAPPSANTLWRNESFRNYADYAAGSAFRAGLDELRTVARGHRCALMCAEAVWWRCHRRIIADYLLVSGTPVIHILGSNKSKPATLTPGAQELSDGTVLYCARLE